MKRVIYFKKRTVVLIAICCFILILCPYIVYAIIPNMTVSKFVDTQSGVIVIDPGHGGIDSGAIRNNFLEKDINLDTALKLKDLLVQRGYIVIMTREEDISLEKSGSGRNRHIKDLDARVKMINNSNAQLYVSIHTNYSPRNSSANGSIVFYNKKYEQNVLLAYNLQRALNSVSVGGMVRTIHNPVAEKYYILDHAKVPGALAEIGFLTNSRERELLRREDFRKLVAEAIMSGIDQYLGKPIIKFKTESN